MQSSSTWPLQRYLSRGQEDVRTTDQKRLCVLDESSLASTKPMHTFLERLPSEDRVLLVGEVRQHEAVDAGRPYHQLQGAVTGVDRQWAERYEEGDVVRYSRGSKALGIEAGDYARVEQVDAKLNQVTVRTDDDRTVSYDPRRLQGVTLYRETERAFAAGDRVQMTAPDRGLSCCILEHARLSLKSREGAGEHAARLLPRLTKDPQAARATAVERER
jgi:hypothetical protein